MKVTVLGSGAWGTALAMVLDDNGHDVMLWSHRKETAESLRQTRENRLLKGVHLPEGLTFTDTFDSIAESEMVVFATPSFAVRETARKIVSYLKPGTILAYTGDLGAGKTAFTRGLARGLGCRELVTSPTYTIVNEYLSGRLPLFHFDMYRLTSSDDLWDIGWEDYLARGGICAVEWSENVTDAMEQAIWVRIEKTGEESRRITMEGGEGFADLSF